MRKRGLTGTQGVLIPEFNVQYVMFRRYVIQACATGKFFIYPVTTIDQGIELLTSRSAGERGSDAIYPAQSLNRAVEDWLRAFACIGKVSAVTTMHRSRTGHEQLAV